MHGVNRGGYGGGSDSLPQALGLDGFIYLKQHVKFNSNVAVKLTDYNQSHFAGLSCEKGQQASIYGFPMGMI